jgi:hypothetical protein
MKTKYTLMSRQNDKHLPITLWPQSASELYRPSDRRLSANRGIEGTAWSARRISMAVSGIQKLMGWIQRHIGSMKITFVFIDTFVSLAIPSLQLRLTTNLFSNLDYKLKTNRQYLSIDQCRVLVLICSHILLPSLFHNLYL